MSGRNDHWNSGLSRVSNALDEIALVGVRASAPAAFRSASRHATIRPVPSNGDTLRGSVTSSVTAHNHSMAARDPAMGRPEQATRSISSLASLAPCVAVPSRAVRVHRSGVMRAGQMNAA